MRTSEERVAELHKRMERMRRTKSQHRYRAVCIALCAACMIVTVGFSILISQAPLQSPTQAGSGATASIFAENPVLGYIVVALVALLLGISVTVFCFRLKQHMAEKENYDD